MTTALRLERPFFVDLSARVKLRVSGADVVRYLNGQITNNLAKASESAAIQGSILNAKGKLSAHVFLWKEGEGRFLLDADPELREELPARLERYIIADDVQLEDVTERFSIFHVVDDSQPTAAGSARTVAANRFGFPGWDVWSESGIVPQLPDDFAFCDDPCAEVVRIERGIPRWGRELTNEIIPVEANLEASSIDYAKGCYIGQEVISRMKMSGQRNKSLCGLLSLSGAALEAGAPLVSADEPAKEVGWVTSATRSARLGKEIALGFVKRGYNDAGKNLSAAGIPVVVVELPFV
jgi:folate-binding protein YgfZ